MSESLNKNKLLLITGGGGFLGKSLIKNLTKFGYNNLFFPSRKDYDLTKEDDVQRLFKAKEFEIVIHLASSHGGIYYNISERGNIYFQNVMMNTLMIHYSMINKINKIICAGTVDSYPKAAKLPFEEKDLWNGYPESTSAPYAFSKKLMIVQGGAYKEQFNFNSMHLLFMNLYGPNDDFELSKSHVIPAIIVKIDDAIKNNKQFITLYGDGTQKRDFLYVDDAAKAIVLSLGVNKYHLPINIGTGRDISIKELANKISFLMGYKGKIKWDKSKPSGYKRKCFNIDIAQKIIGFSAETKIDEGLKSTIAWYKETKKIID